MKTYRPITIAACAAVALAALAAGYFTPLEAAEIAVSELHQKTHIHGLAVDRTNPSHVFIATHHGLFHAGPDGNAELVSEVQDFMGFNPHPAAPDTLYASGHPATGGNLGFIASTDQGRTWQQISPGVNGPVDFHQMSVSPADPNTIYGVYGDLQISRDGGKSWMVAAPAPDRLIDLAASSSDADKLYAATEAGLLASTDAGKSWAPVLEGAPVSLVEVAPDGAVYAFVLGRGLLRSKEEPLSFATVSNDFGEGYLLHVAVDPANSHRLFAATGDGEVLASTDQGRSWTAFGSGS